MNMDWRNMRKSIALFCLMVSSFNSVKAETIDCFIVKEGSKYLIKEGKDCGTQYSPASTFKVPLAVIGYDSGILMDENHPIWVSKKPVTFLKDYWEGEKTPSSWMRFSIVWYSQVLTTKLGKEKFQNYINKLNYGNKNLTGNLGKNDGLTEAWLSSSLLISPLEQIVFIENLAKNELPVSVAAQIKAKKILRLFEESWLSNGWTLYGKTGTDVDQVTGIRRGYFVGFAEKDKRMMSYVMHMTGDKGSKFGGISSKKTAMERMMGSVLNEASSSKF